MHGGRRMLLFAAWAAIVVVTSLTALLLAARYGAEWREQTIQAAVAESSGPAFWWPLNWRSEYRDRELNESIQQAKREEYRARYRAAKALLRDRALAAEEIGRGASIQAIRQRLLQVRALAPAQMPTNPDD